MLTKHDVTVVVGEFSFYSPEIRRASDIHDVAVDYGFGTSSCEKTDQGDGQVTRIFVVASKDYLEQRLKKA